MNLITKSVKELKMYENNPRNNDNAVDEVAESIKNFGFKVPMVIDKNNVIVCGHTRYKACIKLGIEEVPCIIADDLTDEQIKQFRIIENKSSENATWDFEKLYEEMQEIGMSTSEFNYDKEFNELLNEKLEEVDVPAPSKDKPICQRGDVWQLGNHRLMCGDSTKKEDVDKLMNGELADLIATDPPYNVNYEEHCDFMNTANSQREQSLIYNDNLSDEEFDCFLADVFQRYKEIAKDGTSYYCWCGSLSYSQFEHWLKENGFNVKEHLIWVKNAFTLGRQDYQWRHELCIYGWKEGAGHYFSPARDQDTIYEDELPCFENFKKEELVQILNHIYSQEFTTIYENKPVKNWGHPTMKPIKLMGKLILNSSRENELVVDLFGGSGSTLIACEETNRRCNTMELDEHYCDVIIKRWEDYTGKKAVKL